MKPISRFLVLALALVSVDAGAAPVAQTVGSNLTAYDNSFGVTNNNNWNSMMNARGNTGATKATADFGNCNALIMRCAQPKCANGGCTDMNITSTIVSGCVQANETCKKHGNDLVQYISAQLVASSTAKANEAAAAASAAAASAAQQQSAAQMQQMQAQMQQMQTAMANQSAQMTAQLESALAQQQQMNADAIAAATAAAEESAVAQTPAGSLTDTQRDAAASGVSAEVLAREQIANQILSKIEGAQTALKAVESAMIDTFNYAGCDSSGNNCTGPKRVKRFKDRALTFFEPYENVLNELYDALIMAQSVGVDISDVYMLLSGSCNLWGQYMCDPGQVMYYNYDNCPNGTSNDKKDTENRATRGGARCTVGDVVPVSDNGCRLVRALTDETDDQIREQMLWPEPGDTGAQIRVACMSDVLDNSTLFRSVKKQSTIDMETLEALINQDAPNYVRNLKGAEVTQYCAMDEEDYTALQKHVMRKTLPATDLCMSDEVLKMKFNRKSSALLIDVAKDAFDAMGESTCLAQGYAQWSSNLKSCFCVTEQGRSLGENAKENCDEEKSVLAKLDAEFNRCYELRGKWKQNGSNVVSVSEWNVMTYVEKNQSSVCDCANVQGINAQTACVEQFPDNNRALYSLLTETDNAAGVVNSGVNISNYLPNDCTDSGGTENVYGGCDCYGTQFSPATHYCTINGIKAKSTNTTTGIFNGTTVNIPKLDLDSVKNTFFKTN